MRKLSKIFYSAQYSEIQDSIKSFLNKVEPFLTKSTVNSPRAVGDAIQDIITDNFELILGNKYCGKYSSDFARRSMADLAFEDNDGLYYIVDVKTHRYDTKFNMPNITSVERLSRFYEDDRNSFIILMIEYGISDLHLDCRKVTFVPIEFLSWECLTIGALGWGQIQIANSNNIVVMPKYSRKNWMLELCDILLEFYPKEISKIGNRISHFQKIRQFWLSKSE